MKANGRLASHSLQGSQCTGADLTGEDFNIETELTNKERELLEKDREILVLQEKLRRSENLAARQVEALESIARSFGVISHFMENMGIPVSLCTKNGLGQLFPIHVQPTTERQVMRSQKRAKS